LAAEVPDEAYTIPFGEAEYVREGDDVTLVVFGPSIIHANAAAAELAKEGIDCEIIDPRTTSPLDTETILESLERTGRLVLIDESPPRCSLASDVAGIIADKGFKHLKAPIKMVTSPHTPVPFSPTLEDAYMPNASRIIPTVKDLMAYGKS